MRPLLAILVAEEELCNDIEREESLIERCSQPMPNETEELQERYKGVVEEHTAVLNEYQRKLLKVRKELKDYVEMIKNI